MSKFNRGDIVWGKMKFFSWWPAMVLDPGDCGIKNSNPNKCVLFWFGDYNISQVAKEKIASFKDKFQKFGKRERVQEAVNEALTVLAAANDLTFDNGSNLVKWANEGFPATVNWEVQFRWTKLDLPHLIQKALPKKPEALSDENDTKDDVKKMIVKVLKEEKSLEDDVKKMIVKVLKGEKSLEEICIGCCNENATLVQSHPLFLGKVCSKCKKDVDRANNLPCGADHKYCIVCGQGGSLVYCSKRMCSRAFCHECIQYLDYEDSFQKIMSLETWPCYLCDPVKKENCLIRKRATKRKIQSPVPNTVPVSKKARQDRTNSRIDRVITAVMIGIKDLDDICIACCKEGVELVCNHPLFIGKICKKCKKDVMKVWSLPSGKFHNFCIVCGQGGSIVYCSNDVCSRAFCKECIEYLDCQDTFDKITSMVKWPCYLCVKRQNCLIRKRVMKQEVKDTAPNQVSVTKSVKQKVQNPVPNRIPVSKSMKQKFRSTAPNRVSASKSTYHARSDSSIGDVIVKLVSGRIHLEDVCIACCREGVELLFKHPLFIGKICKRCKKDVMKICNLPIGKYQDFCIVCGQGGSLAYCSSDRCLRAYCKLCIEYLDDREWAYEEIVKAEDWFCYLCKPNRNKNCLIKKREIHEGLVDTPPTSPDVKFPENSIDSDEIATSSDNAADDKRFANFTAADSSESSFYIKEEPSDSTADDEKSMDYSTASAYDSSVEDKAFEKCLAATTPKKSSSKKASAANNVVDDKAVGNGFAATLSKTSSTKKGKSSSSIVIREVREGKRYLEDICIACRKMDAYVLTDHPLLIGVICCHCYLDVLAVCNDLLPKDRVNFCVICGQESVNLLCCSYKDCSRAYCKICVEYLDSKEAFAINVEDKNWICYLSEAYKKYSFKEDKFLIKQRSPIKHREHTTRYGRLRRKNISKVGGDLKTNVREGVVKIEDICIACYKSEYELREKSHIDLVVHHPLFFGSICESCVHDVATVCKLPYGKVQDLCIVCGQHGHLVYCSKEECSRAYCRQCIEFLDSEVAFNKILKNSHWECYFCEFCKNRKCIIRRRFPPDNYTYDGDAKLELYTPQQSTEDNKKKLWAGELTLKDVCIACLELITDYPMPHPLFKGKVCLKCLNDVHKACSLRSGTMHDQCVVCGQGGDLIYCSNNLCLKAYCKPCIECLDVENSYSQILENENWFCYFCDLHPPSKSFIQRKEIHKIGTKKFPEVPKTDDRPPIKVLATNDQGEHALKKAKIEVKMYNKDRRPLPSLLGQEPVLYDLVLGSFFVEDKEKSREKLCEDFFKSFDHFNNRRLHCDFHDVDHELYYIFIGDYLIMDGDMLTKIAEKIHVRRQFYTILPVLFEFGERKFLAWSNLSYHMPPGRAEADEGPYIDKRRINAGRYIDNQTVEKEICYFFVKYLQKYFKSKA